MINQKTNMILFYLSITFLASLLLTFTIYLSWSQDHNKWPFYKKSENQKSKKISFSYDINNNNNISITHILIFMIFFIFIGFIIYFIFKANIERYKIVGEAIKHGQVGIATAALAPEITDGISNVFGINNRYY